MRSAAAKPTAYQLVGVALNEINASLVASTTIRVFSVDSIGLQTGTGSSEQIVALLNPIAADCAVFNAMTISFACQMRCPVGDRLGGGVTTHADATSASAMT